MLAANPSMLGAIENRIKAANGDVVAPTDLTAQATLQLIGIVGEQAATGLAETAGPYAAYLAEQRAQTAAAIRAVWSTATRPGHSTCGGRFHGLAIVAKLIDAHGDGLLGRTDLADDVGPQRRPLVT
jgi:hypothetical protein